MQTADGAVRSHYQGFADWLERTPNAKIAQKRDEAERAFHRVGITFAVYGEDAGTERLIPFDIVPRIIPGEEWRVLERGLKQRVRALNLFLHDIYHEQAILKAGVIPEERVLNNTQYRREMQGMDVPGGIYAHIAGVDVVRAGEGEYYVLEDNLRVPSGVSYMLENRKMMMRLFPELFATQAIKPVEHYPDLLLENLRGVAPSGEEQPEVAVLTPGAYNSAYFEHAFLAQQMGVELVEGQDLFVQNDAVYMRTTRGPQRVHVLYRRVDDDFLDPMAFRADSMLGVPGLFSAYRAGQGDARQRDRHRRGRRQVDLPVRPGDDPLLPDGGADTQQRADVAAAQARRAGAIASNTSPNWWSRRCMAPAATACWSGRRRAMPSARRFAIASSRSRRSTSRSRRLHCRPARPSPNPASRRATSTCAPTFCRARPSTSCPAGSPASRCAKARWWSIRRRAAAPRTPG